MKKNRFESKLNYWLLIFRIIFIIVCIFFLFVVYFMTPGDFPSYLIPWYGKVPATLGLIFGISYCSVGAYRGSKKIIVNDNRISIRRIFSNAKEYSINEVAKIKETEDYTGDLGVFKGVEIFFKNKESYDFYSYNHLQFDELKKNILALKKR
jgi:hypothetical protein